ncbi:MAG: nucleotidyltransferase [Gammaproteobacteria bacterium]|nr:nucleotidyltransferase [Gammaproteobacteria bacterium]
MLNILIPMAGKSVFFEHSNYMFPKSLSEVRGQPMIQCVIEDLNTIDEDINYIFAINKEDCKKFHLDNVLKLLTDDKAEIIRVDGETSGAACTALLAIESINNDDPLIISNSDQKFDCRLDSFIKDFVQRDLDAGVICFNSVHPRWSYALTDESGRVVEASEKRPISKQAIAGFFYFKHGKDFVRAAMESIVKDASIGGNYYIAPVLNEMILSNKNIGIGSVENKNYHTFYSPQLLEEYNRGQHCD